MPVHVIGFLANYLTETGGCREDGVRVIDVDVNFRLSFATGENKRITERRKCFT